MGFANRKDGADAIFQIDPKRAIPRPESGIIRNDKLFVRHIPQSMDQGSFREHFSQFGTIVDCNLMMDRETGMHRGFGFVTYEDANSTTTATAQGHQWDGQMVGPILCRCKDLADAQNQLEVKLATQKTQGQSTYVGDRPNRGQRNFNQGNNFQNQDGGMGGYGGGFNNNMGGMGMNNMGAMGGMNAMGGMGGMGNMGNMGMGNQGGFDPMAMAQFFKQVSKECKGVKSRNSAESCVADGLGQLQSHDGHGPRRNDGQWHGYAWH